jgi:hypothetical protein
VVRLSAAGMFDDDGAAWASRGDGVSFPEHSVRRLREFGRTVGRVLRRRDITAPPADVGPGFDPATVVAMAGGTATGGKIVGGRNALGSAAAGVWSDCWAGAASS